MFEKTDVYIRIGPKGNLPVYATAGSAGCDLIAAAPLILRPGESRILPLDLVIALEPGVEAQIRPRSGLSLRTALRLPNSPGTIDSDYRHEVGVLVQNTFSMESLAEQMICQPQLIDELAAKCRRVTISEYLTANRGSDGETARSANLLNNQFPELATKMIYLDDQGNPWGTIYIRPGDRIAQMVFSRCLQANFIEHSEPEKIGTDRGGGFGSTGIKSDRNGT